MRRRSITAQKERDKQKAGRAISPEIAEELQRKLDGGHLTRQRVAVFEYLKGVEHHPTAEEVFLAVKPALPKISLATVYKSLEALADCGLISKLTFGDSSARYDIRTDHHYHTHCLVCGRISDLEAKEQDQLLKAITAPSDFEVKGYRLELLGYCQKCK